MNRSIPSTFALLAALATTTSCHRPSETGHPPTPDLPAATVSIFKASRLTRQATEELVGTVHARLRATLEARVSGRVTRLPVTLGQSVRQGQVLAELDAQEIQARFDQANAAADQTRREQQRFATLLQQNAATQQEFDAIDARHRAAEASLAEARSLLDYIKIPAPFDGVVTRKFVDVGDLASPGRPLLELEDGSAYRFEVDIPEALAGSLKTDTKLNVRIDATGQDLPATVAEISPSADPASRTFRVKLDLPGGGPLRSGQFGRLAIPTGETSSLRVPAAAVLPRGQMELAFVVIDGRARLRLVKTGKRFGPDVEILSGIEEGDPLVLNAAQIVDGQSVEIR